MQKDLFKSTAELKRMKEAEARRWDPKFVVAKNETHVEKVRMIPGGMRSPEPQKPRQQAQPPQRDAVKDFGLEDYAMACTMRCGGLSMSPDRIPEGRTLMRSRPTPDPGSVLRGFRTPAAPLPGAGVSSSASGWRR